jgi:uroporphyrin-3 C-methyltransferase
MRISLFSLLLSVAALGLSVFQYQHFLRVHPPIESQLQKQAKAIMDINENVVTLKDALKKVSNEQAAVLSKPSEPLRDMSSKYALYEIASMIRLSVLQLEFKQNPKLASLLLKSVDKKIENMQDDRFKALREALVQDITALDGVLLPDIQGVWLKLGAILHQVDEFPTQWNLLHKKEDSQKPQEINQLKTSDSDASWKHAFEQGWHELKDLIKIQHHDKPITPLLTEEEQALTIQYLKLILEQARWAVVNVQPEIYLASIQEAQQYLSRYFEITDGGVQQAMQTLKALESVDIKPRLPNLNETLNQLKSLETQEAVNKI